jgi:anti-sigma regulatory factor (Ser/Thr protein kinase)
MDPEVKLEIKLPHVPDIELVAIEGLEKMGKFCGITDDKIGEAKIIVAEAIINALEHSGEEKACVNVEFIMNNKK